jgi:hypothetical protein
LDAERFGVDPRNVDGAGGSAADGDDGPSGSDTDSSMDPVTGEPDRPGDSNGQPGRGDGPTRPGPAEPPSSCARDRVQVPGPFTGMRELTRAGFSACQERCGEDQSCFNEDNCPGLESFDACANTEILRCTADPREGACRMEYEDAVCCVEASGCAAQNGLCVQQRCGQELQGFQACVDQDPDCVQRGIDGCFADSGMEGPSYPECAREDIDVPPRYQGRLRFTEQNLRACQQRCGQNQGCYTEQNCPGIDAFNDCANSSLLRCTASERGSCRAEYENAVCCLDDAGCAQNDNACADRQCGGDIAELQMCVDANDACRQETLRECLAPTSPFGAAQLPRADVMGALQLNERSLHEAALRLR